MTLFPKIAAAALTAAFAALFLKKQAPEYAFLLALAAGLCILWMLAGGLSAVQAWAAAIGQVLPDPDGILTTMGRAAGICVLTKLTAETCRDCEQRALAAKVELAGAAACLTAAFPLAERLLDQIGAML